jgi:hemolysin III
MKKKLAKLLYIPTFGEEVANAVSHGAMAILALFALPFSAVICHFVGIVFFLN